MQDAFNFLSSVMESIFTGLDSVNCPVLGYSFMIVFLAVLVINGGFWVLRVLTGGSFQKDHTGKIDNNNNYIYR